MAAPDYTHSAFAQHDMHAIAAAYDRAPTFERPAVIAWRELARDSLARARVLRLQYAILVTDAPEPYPDAETMFADLDAGRFVVTSANSEHPLWNVQENVAFRIVHDIVGHYNTGGDFSWQGELLACGAHARALGYLAGQALFTECIGQTAYANVHGHFGPQKVALIS